VLRELGGQTRRFCDVLAGAEANAAAGTPHAGEDSPLRYVPSCDCKTEVEWAARWSKGRERDRQFRSTLSGPHRDDFLFLHAGQAAADYASEGQQRGLVLALRLAQAEWFRAKTGLRPVLLADDVLGELDPVRRRRFWAAIDPQAQVIATGTQPPDASLGEWQLFEVSAGGFSECDGGAVAAERPEDAAEPHAVGSGFMTTGKEAATAAPRARAETEVAAC